LTPPASDPLRALAVETSSRHGSIAVAQGDRVLARRDFTQQRRHAVELLPCVDAALAELGWRPGDLQHVYVSAGPGSFTGLRIAITFARALAQAVGSRIVLVPTPEALALNAPAHVRHLAVVLDAKRGQVYAAIFSRSADGEPWTPAVPVGLYDPPVLLAAVPRPLHVLGEGIDYHRDALGFGDDLIELPRATWRPRAEAVWTIGRRMAQAGRFTPLQDATPIYVRRPEAEEKWEQLHGGQG